MAGSMRFWTPQGGGVVLCNWEAQKAMFIDRERRWCCVFSLIFIDVHLHKYVYIYIYIYLFIYLSLYMDISTIYIILIFKLGWLHVPRKPNCCPLPKNLRWTQWQKHPQGCAFFRCCIGRWDRRLDGNVVHIWMEKTWKILVLLTFLGNFYWNINSLIFQNGFQRSFDMFFLP